MGEMKSISNKNLEQDNTFAREGIHHTVHHYRKEPTLYLLHEAYTDGCRTLLDIGCDGGWWLGKARKIGFDATGLDHAPFAAVDIIHDANDLSIIKTNSYDAVKLTETGEHLSTHPEKTLAQCKRIASHSVIVSVPGATSKWGGVQAKDVNRVEEINFDTHVWYIPKDFFFHNSCVVNDVSQRQWTILRIRT